MKKLFKPGAIISPGRSPNAMSSYWTRKSRDSRSISATAGRVAASMASAASGSAWKSKFLLFCLLPIWTSECCRPQTSTTRITEAYCQSLCFTILVYKRSLPKWEQVYHGRYQFSGLGSMATWLAVSLTLMVGLLGGLNCLGQKLHSSASSEKQTSLRILTANAPTP